jgi:hypothetical protein
MDWVPPTASSPFGRGSQTGASTPYSGSSTPLSGSFPNTGGGFLAGLGGHHPAPQSHSHNHHPNTNSHYNNHGYHAHHQPLPQLDIQLDSDEILLRGAGSDYNPALLSGNVVLNLQESTNIREISMRLEGKAKVVFHEGGA